MAGDDVELDAVAVLDAEDGRLAGVPGEGDDQGVAGADGGDAGEEDAEGAGGNRGEGDRPEAGEGDPGGALVRQRGGGAGAGEGVADVVGRPLRPAEVDADRQRDQPPERGDDGDPGVAVAVRGEGRDRAESRRLGG